MGLRAGAWVKAACLAAGLAATAPALAEAPEVAVSIKPVHALVSGVMEGVGVPALIIRGAASPHGHGLRPSDARAVQNADVIFWVGGSVETSLAKPIAALGGNAVIIELLEDASLELLAAREGGPWASAPPDEEEQRRHRINGHVWLDPHNAAKIVATVVRTLSVRDPANAGRYAENGHAMTGRLSALNAELQAALAPVRSVPYVVFHDAYHYFERRYGLNAIGAIAIHTGQAPGAKRIYELRQKIIALKARCVFSEPQFEPQLIATVIGGTPVRAGVLDPLGAELPAGPALYFTLLRALGHSLTDCLSGAP